MKEFLTLMVSFSSDRQCGLQAAQWRSRNHLGQYMFCFPLAAKKSLHELLLPSRGCRYKSFSDISIKVTENLKEMQLNSSNLSWLAVLTVYNRYYQKKVL